MVLLRYDPPPMLQVKQNNNFFIYEIILNLSVLQRKSLVKILDGSLIIIETSLKKKKK